MCNPQLDGARNPHPAPTPGRCILLLGDSIARRNSRSSVRPVRLLQPPGPRLGQAHCGPLGAAREAVFWDEQSLQPGFDWRSEIGAAIDGCRVMVLCWCCDTALSPYVEEEVRRALRGNKRLVPVRLCDMPLPEAIAARHWIDLSARAQHHCREGTHMAGQGCATGCFDAAGGFAGARSAGWIVSAILFLLLLSSIRHPLADSVRWALGGVAALARAAPLLLPLCAVVCLAAAVLFLLDRRRKRAALARLDARLEQDVRAYFERLNPDLGRAMPA